MIILPRPPLKCDDCGRTLGPKDGTVCRAQVDKKGCIVNEEIICNKCSGWPKGFNVDMRITREDYSRVGLL